MSDGTRTVKRDTLPLNAGKVAALRGVIQAYAKEKEYWLKQFQRKANRDKLQTHRVVRDAAVKAGHKSVLQARMWKLAQAEGADTWHKCWSSCLLPVKQWVHQRKDFSEPDKHYLFWLMRGYPQFFASLKAVPLPDFDLSRDRCERLCVLFQRKVKAAIKKEPVVRIARSAVFDANCYNTFEEGGTQYVKVMSLQSGKRIAIPLMGKTGISGNIRVVMESDDTVKVHVGFEFDTPEVTEGEEAGVDRGYTEVFVDDKGNEYGKGLGEVLTVASDRRHETGKARNKLRAIAEKSNPVKAWRIRKNNLGDKKWEADEAKTKATINCKINQGLNRLIEVRKPLFKLGHEDFSKPFTFLSGAKMNRLMAGWVRGTTQKRTEFKAQVEGFHLEPVNAAYSSQSCPKCDFTDRRNRKGDCFLCLVCAYVSSADHVGGLNVKHRMNDPEITRWTPYREVKLILNARHQRWLETKREAAAKAAGELRVTVPGRTLDTEGTASVGSPNAGGARVSTETGRSKHSAKAKATAKAVPQRAKQKTMPKV
jgi:putative transposase